MNESDSIYSWYTRGHSRTELLSSYVWHGTDGESPLHDTKDLLRLPPGEQERDSNSVTIPIFIGAVHYIEGFNI